MSSVRSSACPSVRLNHLIRNTDSPPPGRMQAVRKRLAALHLSSPIVDLSPAAAATVSPAAAAAGYRSAALSRTEGISLLVSYLDAYYLDLASWLSLATAYSSLAQYSAARTCLAHACVLSPHDPFVHLKHAETAYTLGDVALAWKGFCRVIEMSTLVDDDAADATLNHGAARRAAVGAKLVSHCERESAVRCPFVRSESCS